MLTDTVVPTLTTHRRPLIWAGAVVGGLVALWLLLFLVSGGGIARGTSVRGVEIGGLSPAAAQARLETELGDEARQDVRVRVDGDDFAIDPAAAGLTLDAAATVDNAEGRTVNPVALVARLFGSHDVDPVAAVDGDKLAAAVAGFAERVDGKPVDGDVQFRGGRAVAVAPVPGRDVDRSAAADELRSAYLRSDEPVDLPAEVTAPAVGQAEVDRAMKEFAEPAMSGPVDLTVDGRSLPVTPALLAPALSMAPDDENRLRPALDGRLLKLRLATLLAGVEVPAKDATFRVRAGRPRVVPAVQGREIVPADLAKDLLPALTAPAGKRTVALALKVSDPELTTAEAQALGVTELVSEYTTYYPSDFAPRLTNIHRAADLMDGTLVLPGDEFSLNRAVGERTKARGFAAGYIINKGKLEVDYGGGVSQLATTTFNAAFFAGLKDVEHHTHSFYISRYPEGREATVAWGAKDLRFANDSGHAVFVTTAYTSGSVTVRIWGTKAYLIEARKSDRYAVRPFETVRDPRPEGTDQGDCVHQDGVNGFQVDVTRVFLRGGQQVRTEKFHTVYQPEDKVLCGSALKVAEPPTD